jgi:hypothetical protein
MIVKTSDMDEIKRGSVHNNRKRKNHPSETVFPCSNMMDPKELTPEARSLQLEKLVYPQAAEVVNTASTTNMSTESISAPSTTSLEQFPFLPLQQLRLEAIFYPKFENEQPQIIKSSHNKVIQTVSKNTTRLLNDDTRQSSMREQMIQQCLTRSDTETKADPSADWKQQQNHSDDATASATASRGGGSGYIEVSIKHSGSLILWSGQTRFYSKNSTNNAFTYTCEILLRQHFYRYARAVAHHVEQSPSQSSNDDDDEIIHAAEQLYQNCSQFIARNRLTVSFEVVTSVLGDHGARPNYDYIIVTAIADRHRIRNHKMNTTKQHTNLFYTTMEVIQFAQEYHLPHNDYWIYQNESSIHELFHLYDTGREIGTTSTIIPALTNAAMHNLGKRGDCNNECDYFIQSMYPHATYQGEILEGIVIRYVPHVASESMEQIQRLAQISRGILHQFAAATTFSTNNNDAGRKEAEKTNAGSFPNRTLYTINLRDICGETKTLNTKKSTEVFEERLRNLLLQSVSAKSENTHRLTIQRMSEGGRDIPLWIENLHQEFISTDNTEKNPNDDIETYKIAKLIHDVSLVSKNITYGIFKETPTNQKSDDITETNTSDRYLCIVHVLHDQTFHKYHRFKSRSDLPLFRGFSFQLIGCGDGREGTVSCDQNDIRDIDSQASLGKDTSIDVAEYKHDDGDGETLMLKMKFLPYMVR